MKLNISEHIANLIQPKAPPTLDGKASSSTLKAIHTELSVVCKRIEAVLDQLSPEAVEDEPIPALTIEQHRRIADILSIPIPRLRWTHAVLFLDQEKYEPERQRLVFDGFLEEYRLRQNVSSYSRHLHNEYKDWFERMRRTAGLRHYIERYCRTMPPHDARERFLLFYNQMDDLAEKTVCLYTALSAISASNEETCSPLHRHPASMEYMFPHPERDSSPLFPDLEDEEEPSEDEDDSAEDEKEDEDPDHDIHQLEKRLTQNKAAIDEEIRQKINEIIRSMDEE